MRRPGALTVDTPNGPVAVRVFPARDPGAGRIPLVCVHGLTDSGLVYEALWKALGREWPVVAPDLPGHGGTPWRPSPVYDIEEPVGGLARLLDHLPDLVPGAAGCVLLGHSVAVITVAALAVRRPDVVRHLVLEEPPRRPVLARRAQRKEQVWLDRLQGLDHVARQVAAQDNLGWAAEDLDQWSRSKVGVDRRMFDAQIGWGDDLTMTLGQVRCPVTIVLGEVGRGSLTRSRRLRRLLAAGRTPIEAVRLPGAGHNPRRDAPDAFVATLRVVLQRHSDTVSS